MAGGKMKYKKSKKAKNIPSANLTKKIKHVLKNQSQINFTRPAGMTGTDYSISGTTTTICCTNGISSGPGLSQRIGSLLKPLCLELKFEIHTETGTFTGADAFNNIRLLVWQLHERHESGSPPPLSTVLEDTSTTRKAMYCPNKNKTFMGYGYPGDNIGTSQQKDNVTVHYDQILQLGPPAAGTGLTVGGNRPQSIVRHLKLKNFSKVSYNANEATDAIGHIYVQIISDSNWTPSPQMVVWGRLWYKDIV